MLGVFCYMKHIKRVKENQKRKVTCYERERVDVEQPFRTVITFLTLVAYLLYQSGNITATGHCTDVPSTR